MAGFGQASPLSMLQHLFSCHGTIDEINLEENVVKMMGTYDLAEPLYRLIEKLEKGRELEKSGGQTIVDAMMVSKGNILLAHTSMSKKNTRKWRRQTNDQKTWAHLKIFFHQTNRNKRKAVTTTGKGGYDAAVQTIYGVPPPPP